MIANVISILYNSSANKKLISSELHFGHNIVCFVFCWGKAFVRLKSNTVVFFFLTNHLSQ